MVLFHLEVLKEEEKRCVNKVIQLYYDRKVKVQGMDILKSEKQGGGVKYIRKIENKQCAEKAIQLESV